MGFLLCVTLGLAPAPAAAITKPECGIFSKQKKCDNVAGCSWMKTGTKKFKSCQNIGDSFVEKVVEATVPSVETPVAAPAPVCASFSKAKKCRKQAGCDWYKTADQKRKTCQAVVTATVPSVEIIEIAAPPETEFLS